MTREQFQELPWLLLPHQVRLVVGYAPATVLKLMDCGVLKVVQPAGSQQSKVQKIQVAQLVKLVEWLDWERWKAEPALMGEKAVTAWTGYAGRTLKKMVEAKSLELIRPAGLNGGRYRKTQVGKLIGLE